MVTKEPGTSEPSSACRAVPSVTACGVRERGEGEGRVSDCGSGSCAVLYLDFVTTPSTSRISSPTFMSFEAGTPGRKDSILQPRSAIPTPDLLSWVFGVCTCVLINRVIAGLIEASSVPWMSAHSLEQADTHCCCRRVSSVRTVCTLYAPLPSTAFSLSPGAGNGKLGIANHLKPLLIRDVISTN
jgi:hypothetical protein